MAYFCNLDMWKWEMGTYPAWFKERMFAFYNMHHLVEMHKQDAENRALARRAKKGRR